MRLQPKDAYEYTSTRPTPNGIREGADAQSLGSLIWLHLPPWHARINRYGLRRDLSP